MRITFRNSNERVPYRPDFQIVSFKFDFALK